MIRPIVIVLLLLILLLNVVLVNDIDIEDCDPTQISDYYDPVLIG